MAAKAGHFAEMVPEQDITVAPFRKNAAVDQRLAVEQRISQGIVPDMLCNAMTVPVGLHAYDVCHKSPLHVF